MRKPRDYDVELKALEDKARQLKQRKVMQLGELVNATGADALTPDELAGALVALAETKDAAKREAWAKRGAAFFAGRSRGRGERSGRSGAASSQTSVPGTSRDPDGALPLGGEAQPAPGGARPS